MICYSAPQGKTRGISCGLAGLVNLRRVLQGVKFTETLRRVQGLGRACHINDKPVQHVGERAFLARSRKTLIR